MNTEISPPRLQLNNITKQFPGVLANDNISISVYPGEILALLGENGAGKTTLMNIVYGLLLPDRGEILLENKPIKIHSPKDAIHNGIGMVHQHFMLVPTLSVAENIILGLRPLTRHILDIKEIQKSIVEVANKYGMQIKPSELVGKLSVGEQQRVEIVKALYRGVNLLILDEPTAVLTPQETRELFITLKSLTENGLSIIFITHKLKEVMNIADRVAVLRDGKLIDTKKIKDTNENELSFMMVDRNISFTYNKIQQTHDTNVLEIKNLTVKEKNRNLLDNVTFNVSAGQIVGVAGVDGNGQNELALTITGLLKSTSGQIILNGKNVTHLPVRKLNQAGIRHIPGDRQDYGLVLDFSVADNLILQEYYHPPFVSRFGFLHHWNRNHFANKLIKSFDIRTNSPHTKVKQLSGGNQQRVILAREINSVPKLLIAVQPTRGLDVGAIEQIHNLLLEQRSKGAAILLISTELDEILALSDQIMVMYGGKIVGELTNNNVDILHIGRMMAGLEFSIN
jgi:simple sugar transport system ATP-binding protein